MKKKFFIAAGIISTSALASEVTLYGRVAAAVENDQFPSPTQVQPGTTSVQDYGSYFGIRGSDQVYGQTDAIWQIEQFLNITSGSAYNANTAGGWVSGHPYQGNTAGAGQNTMAVNTFASSDSYIGLQGAWGRFRIGNLSNTFRTNTGAVDIFNGANANVLGTYDRFLMVIPQMVRIDSPTWSNVSFSLYTSFGNDGNLNTGGVNGNSFGSGRDMNGKYNDGIYGLGVFYTPGDFSLTWNTQIQPNSGVYQTIQNGGSTGGLTPAGSNVTQGINAWVSRVEAGYNNPDSWFIGAGGQISQGYGYFAVPGNGNMQNLWIMQGATGNVNSQYLGTCASSWCPLNTAVLGTAEIGASFGWHVENWTPKISYVLGSNMMNGGSPWDLIAGSNQIGGTGYQQAIAELDWNITPRTIAFVNIGQTFWGNTSNSMRKGLNPGTISGNPTDSVGQAGGSVWINNMTTAIGFSHTF